MTSTQIIIVLVWCLFQFLIGLIGFPLSNYLFKNFPDKGYGFGKIIGIVLIALPLWFFASLRLIPFNNTTILISFLIGLTISLYFIVKNKITINKYMILNEIIFLILFGVWCLIRSTNPRIEGTEKFMNLAFMNSISRSEFFPPQDPWFAGQTINYYYLGHYFITFTAKLARIPIYYVYNLAIVNIICLLFSAIFSLILSFSKEKNVDYIKLKNLKIPFIGKRNLTIFNHTKLRISLAFIGASVVCFGGNLHYIVYYLTNFFFNQDKSYFFPDATRIISNTINEYPAYSVVLGDVHPHYIALPFFVLLIALSFVSIKIKINSIQKIILHLIISPFLCSLYAVNSWDFITINFIFLLINLFGILLIKGSIVYRIRCFIFSELSLLIPGLLIMIPYFIHFHPAVSGLGIVPFKTKSELKPWFLMWGMFLIIFLIYGISLIKKYLKKIGTINQYWTALLVFAGFCLIFGVEVFFLKDIFYKSNPPYFRTNTVFKFYYHAWVIFGIATAFMVNELILKFKKECWFKQSITILFIALLYVGSLSYIQKAVSDFYFPVDTKYTLNGITYIKNENLGDYEAIKWIENNVTGQPVIVEYVGEAYTYATRISTNTGLLTIVGWPTHEWQWHGSPTEPYARKSDVERIYQSTNITDLKDLVKKYNVEYIYIGNLERTKYANLNENNILSISDLIYSSGNTKIYKIK